ncbi:MAG: penicillin-binding protein 2 [Candidatus Zhuqueibacterota bacterium]
MALNSSIQRKDVQFSVLVIVLFVILIVRFFYLQIYKQEQYFTASEKNRIRERVHEAARGIIIDRNGEILVDNHPSYSVYAIPIEVKESENILKLTGEILDMKPAEIKRTIQKKKTGYFTPIKLKRQVDFETLSRIEERRMDLPGILYMTEPRRYYPSGVRAPHLFGYLGEITQEEMELEENKGMHLGSIIGKKGLEKVYEKELRGFQGYEYIEVDALGREVRKLKDKPEIQSQPGKNLHLTLDAILQRALEARMDSLRGGAVVVDCKTGGVLALVSKPDYDPEIFTKPISPEIWNELVNNPSKPLYDRMVQSLFPPGSTYKPVLAAAALEHNIIEPSWRAYCGGFLNLGRRNYDCWKPGGHGELDLLGAIEQSCNVYFYKLELKVGLDKWAEYSRNFLFGELTGIDLIAEKAGVVPDQEYLDRQFGKNKWSKGLILNLAIGQGDLLVTPLQMARFAMILANKGVSHRLHLVEYLEDPIDGTRKLTQIDSVRINGVSQETFEVLKQGMFRVVHGVHGTAKSAAYLDIKVAGKTGTAQNPHGDPHAWFIGYAPVDNPQIAICVLIENGGGGGAVAAPIAREVIKNYFYRNQNSYAQF